MSGGFVADSRIVHLQYEGRSWDVPSSVLGLGDHSSDRDVREAMARHLDVPTATFDAYTVERLSNGNIELRAEAAS